MLNPKLFDKNCSKPSISPKSFPKTCKICIKDLSNLSNYITSSCSHLICSNCIHLLILFNFKTFIKNINNINSNNKNDIFSIKLKCMICFNGTFTTSYENINNLLTDYNQENNKFCILHDKKLKVRCKTCNKRLCFACLNEHNENHDFSFLNNEEYNKKNNEYFADSSPKTHRKNDKKLDRTRKANNAISGFIMHISREETKILDSVKTSYTRILETVSEVEKNLKELKQSIKNSLEKFEGDFVYKTNLIKNVFMNYSDFLSEMSDGKDNGDEMDMKMRFSFLIPESLGRVSIESRGGEYYTGVNVNNNEKNEKDNKNNNSEKVRLTNLEEEFKFKLEGIYTILRNLNEEYSIKKGLGFDIKPPCRFRLAKIRGSEMNNTGLNNSNATGFNNCQMINNLSLNSFNNIQNHSCNINNINNIPILNHINQSPDNIFIGIQNPFPFINPHELNTNYKCIKSLPAHSESILSLIQLYNCPINIKNSNAPISRNSSSNLRSSYKSQSNSSNSSNENHPQPYTYIATGSRDKTIKIWQISSIYTFKCIQTLTGHSHVVNSLCALENGCIASASSDKTIKIWDWRLNYDNTVTLTDHSGEVCALIQLTNGLLVSTSCDKTVKLYNHKYQCIKTLEGHNDYVVYVIVLKDDLIATGSSEGVIKVWYVGDGQYETVESIQCVQTIKAHRKVITGLISLGDGIMASSSWDRTIKVWACIRNKDNSNEEYSCLKTLEGHKDRVCSLTQIDNGLIVSASWDQTVKFWNINSVNNFNEGSNFPNQGSFLDDSDVNDSYTYCVATFEGHKSISKIVQLDNGLIAFTSWSDTVAFWSNE